MISHLFGTVLVRDDPFLIIDVSGVGYKVFASREVLSKTEEKAKIEVFVYTQVREDVLDLYGFMRFEDLKLFEQLLSVAGIGPKMAIAIFAKGTSKEIQQAIVKKDVSFFTGIPRLGKKNAQKIILDLSSKLGVTADIIMFDKFLEENNQVLSALRSFGFSEKEAFPAIRSIKKDGLSTEEQVRQALRYLGK